MDSFIKDPLSPPLCRINGFTNLNLTKLDVLSDLDTIQLGVAYRGSDGRTLPSMPADIRDLEAVEVVYEQLPGWRQDISGARSWDELPPNAKKYIRCAAKGSTLLVESTRKGEASLSTPPFDLL